MIGVYADQAIKKAPQAKAEIETLAKVNYHTNIRNSMLEIRDLNWKEQVKAISNSELIAEQEKEIAELEAMGIDPQTLFDYKDYIERLKKNLHEVGAEV